MEFIEYDASKIKKTYLDSVVTVSKSGKISLSKKLCENLNINIDTKISFLQSKENKKDWYLKVNTYNGISLKLNTKLSQSLYFQFKELSNQILNSIFDNEQPKTIRIKVSTQMHDGMYALLTSSIK